LPDLGLPVIPTAAIQSGTVEIFMEDGMIGWLYEDELGSNNLDCTPTNKVGCWGHRDNILENPNDANQVVGEAEIRGGRPLLSSQMKTWPIAS
jgi:hypothetical protein